MLLKLVIILSDNTTLEYVSDGEYERVGRISSCRFVNSNGHSISLPPAGTIVEICHLYASMDVKSGSLALGEGRQRLNDHTGDGMIDEVLGLDIPAVGRPLAAIAEELCRKAGARLFSSVAEVRARDVVAEQASCYSMIKHIVASPHYTLLEMLHATMPPARGPGAVLQYTEGGDIIHLFVAGTGVLNRVVDGVFQSVRIEVESPSNWQAVVVPPCSPYQVVNTSPDLPLDYFWLFMEHDNAFDRGAWREISREESEAAGWRFAYPK